MKRTSLIAFVTVVMLAVVALVAAAGPAACVTAVMPDSPSTTLFSYQGQVSDAAGNPITNPALPMTYTLYTVATGGTPCWTEAHTGGNAVAVTKGLFNVVLGQLAAIPSACLTADAYLELVVNGETLSPRELLTSVAFAVEASTLAAGATTRGNLTVPGSFYTSGNSGFGTSSAGARARLSVVGGALSISQSPIPADATLHIQGALGVGDRLLQMSPVGVSQPAVALVGSTDSAGNGQWWEWGVTSANTFRIVPGFSLGGATGLAVAANGDVSVGGKGTFSRDGASRYGQHTLNVAESSSVTGKQADIGFHNAGHVEGYMRLDTGPGGREFVFASELGDMDGYFSGDLRVGSMLHVAGTDVIMDEFGGRGGGRALTNDNNDTLTINYNKDFTGGVRINGPVSCGALVESNLQTTAESEAGGTDRFTEGDVLCWGIDQLELCSTANDRLVQAVSDASGKPIVLGAEQVKVLGPVQRGDILVASDVPGYAMVNNDPISGSVIAQALEGFDGEQGIIKAMIRKF